MIRRPITSAIALCAVFFLLAACGGGSSKNAASSDSTSSSSKKASSSTSASSDTGGDSSADVTDKSSFCKAAADIQSSNQQVGAALLGALGGAVSDSSGSSSFLESARQAVQSLAPKLSDDYDAMESASKDGLHDDIVKLHSFSDELFAPALAAKNADAFSSALDRITSAGNSSDAKAASEATQRIDAVTSSECNVHIAANQ